MVYSLHVSRKRKLKIKRASLPFAFCTKVKLERARRRKLKDSLYLVFSRSGEHFVSQQPQQQMRAAPPNPVSEMSPLAPCKVIGLIRWKEGAP